METWPSARNKNGNILLAAESPAVNKVRLLLKSPKIQSEIRSLLVQMFFCIVDDVKDDHSGDGDEQRLMLALLMISSAVMNKYCQRF